MKKFLKVMSFVLAFILVFTGIYYVFGFKYTDSVYKMKMFYEQPDNSVDVLVLGSSHAYQGINTAVLWNEYGIASYDLCGAAQPIWNSYYYLEEALKTQTPKVIILDAYTVHYSSDFSETSVAIKNTYGMKWSQTKKDAINASFDTEKYGNQFMFDILQYHTRYSDLNNADFFPYQNNPNLYRNHKGFYCYFYTSPIKDNDMTFSKYINEMTEKNELYYRKIIELAQSKNIPIIITAIPFEAEAYHEAFFNDAKRIAIEYNVPFYDFITDYKTSLKLDYNTDFSDAQHLNFRGNTKLSKFLGNILKSDYRVPDRRNDEKYISWYLDSKIYYEEYDNFNVSQIGSIVDYEQVFSSDRYKIVMTVSGYNSDSVKNSPFKYSKNFFTAMDIPEEQYNVGGVWIFEGGKNIYYNGCFNLDFSKTYKFDNELSAMVRLVESEPDEDGKTSFTNRIYVNNNDCTTVSQGINFYVYDTLTKSRVDAAGLSFKSNRLIHKSFDN